MANSAEAGGLTNTPMLEQVFVNPDHSSQVLYQLSELWRDKKLCDATIEVGPVKVYVHRLVLLAACPYLLTVGGQHEVSILEVKLPMTVGLEGLNVFLTYLYDGVLHLTSGNLRSVEKLTKILKVTSIQKFCQEFRDSNKETGVADKLSTDYSLKMTNSSLQIIFSEIQSEMKRENTEAEPDTPSKRPRMNLDKLSAALQKKSGQSESGKDSERCHSVSSSMPSETQHDDSSSDPLMMQVKEEPVSDYEDDDDGGYSEDTSESFGGTTDFVRQAPYDTRPFPKEPSATSSNKLPVNIPPPPSLQKRPSFKQKSFPPSAQSSETDVASETDTGPEGSSVDATKVLKNIVKSMPEMAMNLGTSSEMGDDNKPRSSDQLPPGPSKSPDSNSPLRKSSRSRRQVIPFSIPVKQSKSKYASKTSDEELECDLEGNNDTEEEQDVLSYDQNQKLVEWVVESTRIGHSVTINDIRYGCKELLDEEGKLHPFFQDNLPTMKWFKTFRQRNPVINECLKVSSAHGKGKVTAEQVSHWFHSFTDYLNEKVLNDPTLLIDPSRWYMVDIGVALSHWKNNRFESHFAGTYGEYSTHKKTKLMTGLHMLVCMGADGHFQKPMVVQKKTNRHLRIKNMMLKMSQSDWFDSSLFYSWLKNVFIPDLYKRRISRPVVLLIDGMTHLLSFSAFQLCEKNGIILYCMEKWEKSKKPCQLKLFPLLAKKLIAIKKKCRQGVNVGNAELLADLDSVWSITRNAHAEIAVEAFRDMGIFPLDHRVGTTRFDVSSSGFGCPEVVIENLEEEEEISGANADINWSLSFSNYTELIKPSTSMLHSEAATENLAMVSDLHPEVTYKAEVDNLNEDITPFGHKPPVSVPQLMSSYEAVNEDMEDFSDANDDFNSAPSNMEYSDEYGTQQRSSSMSRKDLQHGLQNLVKIPKSSPRKWESCLTEEELAMIRDWILDMHRRGFRIIRHGICSAVKFILDQNNIESSLEDTTQERWFYPFFKKKIPEFIPLQKHKINFVFSRYEMQKWFETLSEYLSASSSLDNLMKDPSRWYMVDVAGFSFHSEDKKLFCLIKGNFLNFKHPKGSVLKKGNALLACMCADGHYPTPMQVVHGNRDKDLPVVQNSIVRSSLNRWVNCNLFKCWLNEAFIPDLNERQVQRPVVLLIDDMSMFLSYEASLICQQNGIFLFCSPKLALSKRPLHTEFFPFFEKTLLKILKENEVGLPELTRDVLVKAVDIASERISDLNEQIAISAFEMMGIFPFNPNNGLSWLEADEKLSGNDKSVSDSSKDNLKSKKEKERLMSELKKDGQMSKRNEERPMQDLAKVRQITENSDECGMVDCNEERQMWEHDKDKKKSEGSEDKQMSEVREVGQIPGSSKERQMSEVREVGQIPGSSKERQMSEDKEVGQIPGSSKERQMSEDKEVGQIPGSSKERQMSEVREVGQIPGSSKERQMSEVREVGQIPGSSKERQMSEVREVGQIPGSSKERQMSEVREVGQIPGSSKERQMSEVREVGQIPGSSKERQMSEVREVGQIPGSSKERQMSEDKEVGQIPGSSKERQMSEVREVGQIPGSSKERQMSEVREVGQIPGSSKERQMSEDKEVGQIPGSSKERQMSEVREVGQIPGSSKERHMSEVREVGQIPGGSKERQMSEVREVGQIPGSSKERQMSEVREVGQIPGSSKERQMSEVREVGQIPGSSKERQMSEVREVGQIPGSSKERQMSEVREVGQIPGSSKERQMSEDKEVGQIPGSSKERQMSEDKEVGQIPGSSKERQMSEDKEVGQIPGSSKERQMSEVREVGQIPGSSKERQMSEVREVGQIPGSSKERQMSEVREVGQIPGSSKERQMSEVREVGQIPGSSKERQMSEVREVGQIPGSSKERQMSEDIGIYKDEEKEITNWVEEMASKGIIIGTKEIETSMENMLDKTEHKKIPEWWDKIQHRCPIWSQLSKMNGKMAIEKCFENFTNYINETLKDESLATDQKRLYMLNTAHCNVGPRGQRLYTDVRSKCLKKDVKKKMRGLQVILCMCADGHYPQPMVVMNSVKGYKPSMTKHVVLGLAGMGLIDDIVFMAWIEETFIPHLDRRRIQRPVVLFVDTAVASHLLTFQVYCLCRDNGILLFSQDFSLNSDKKFQTDLFELLSKKWLQVLNDYFRKLTGKQHIFSLLNTTFLSLFDRAWGNTVRESKPFAWEAFCELQVLTSQNTQCASGSGESLMKEDMTKNKANSAVFGGAKLTKGRRQTHSDTSVNLAMSRRNNTLDIAEGIEGYKRKETSNYSCTSHEENTQSKRKKTSQHCSTSHEENSDSKRKKSSNYGSTWHARNNVYLKESSVLLEDLDKVIRLHGLTLISGKCEDDTKKVWKQTESSEEIRPRSQHFLNRATTDFNCPKSGSPRLRKSKKPVRSYKSPKSYVSRSPVKLKDLEASCVETEQLLNMSTFPINTSFVPVPKNCIPVPLPLPSDPDTQDILETARTVIENLASVSKEDGDDVLLDNESMTWGKDFSNHPSALHFKDKTSTVNKDGSEHNVVFKDDDSVIMIDEYVIKDDENDIVIDDNDVCPSPGLYGSEGIVSSTSDDYIHSDGASYTGLVSTAIVDAQDDVDSNEEFEEKIIYPSKFLTVSERIVSSTSKNQGQ